MIDRITNIMSSSKNQLFPQGYSRNNNQLALKSNFRISKKKSDENILVNN
jgi:hypothetical protein